MTMQSWMTAGIYTPGLCKDEVFGSNRCGVSSLLFVVKEMKFKYKETRRLDLGRR
jgi:hypothetical protein